MLKRITSMLLAAVLLLGLFSGQVLAAAQEDISLLAATQTEISLLSSNTPYFALWKKTNLSTSYANCVSNGVVTMNTASGATQPVASYTVTLPNPAETVMLTNTHDNYSYQDEAGFKKDCKFKYVVVGQQTTEDGAVKLDITGATPGNSLFFSNAAFYEEIVDSSGAVTSSTSQLPSSAAVYEDDAQIPVTLDKGNGKVFIFLLIGKPSAQKDGTTKYTYHANYLPYGFEFVYEAQPADPTPTLTKDLTYGGHLCAPGESLTLSVEATIEPGCNLGYQWYSGTNADDVSTKIEDATTASFTPPTSTPGITFYKVVVTGTAEGVNPVSVESTVARVVVRETSAQSFSLETFFDQPVEKLSGSDTVYYLKWSTYAQTNSASPLANGDLRMTGKLPDHVTIKNIWTGSAVDNFDMTSDRTTLTIDDDTGSFNLNITSSYGNNSAVMHCLEKCYYLELSNNEIYTLVVDNDARAYETERSPKSVQLYDENGHTVLEDFTVTDLQSIDTDTSVVRKSLTSQTPVVLRAQVQSGGDDLTLGDVPTNSPISWDEGQNSWLMVNGERFPKTGYFSADAEDTQLLTSPAFSLKPGLNVVEVYTEAFSFNFQAFKGYKSSGITEYNFTRSDGEPSTIPVTIAHPVVYLIDYEGQTAAELPSEASNAELLPPIALRMGDYGSKMENCPILFDEATGKYTLRVPTRYKEETINVAKYNHCILLSLRPAAAGARTEILGVNGLVVGQVRSSVLLDIDALRSLGDNAGFAIRVIAPDGTTQKIHVVNIVYASSTTTPEVTVTGAVLDTPFIGDTYAYYLDYASASANVGTMTVKLPDGSRATVNGTDYTFGDAITLDPKKDFYRLTITAEDNYTVTSYYFVTRYKDTGVIPYQTVSDSSKALAKEMLSGWYDALEGSNMFGNYWRIFMAKATGNRDGSDYNFNRAYVKNPARHEMKQQTDWGACILEIIMLGRNPYDFPRYVNGTYVEHYNYVEGLLNCANGSWANPVWYHMAAKASGATLNGQATAELLALQTKFDLDIRSWAIASLAECVDTKDMVRFVDGLHDSHNTSGPYTSLWTNQSFHGSTGGNTYTIGCVLSAIASGGADPDKQFAYDGHTPLQTIKDVLYVDGLFRPIGGSPALPKDMVIGLGDILHESNVWARYALTEQKYNDLKAKAQELNEQGANITIPGDYVAQNAACGKAYYDLYDAVYNALFDAGRTDEAYAMRPNVHWGMPQEIFADEVNKMPEASALTSDGLADLEKLIAQYEAMDDSSKKAIASDVLSKYQTLVKRGLALKAEGTTADSDKISKIYDKILALPAASEITESNIEATLAKVTEIEQEIGTLSKEETSLLMWMDNSLLQKLEDIKKAAPKPDITVTFTLLGDTHHTITDDSNIHSYRFNAGPVWVEETTVTVAEGSTVGDVFKQVLDKNGLKYTGLDNGYIDSITYTDNTTLTAKDDSRDKSGWLYLVQPKDGKATHPNVGLNAYELSDGDKIIWHWSDDYQIEQGSEHWSASRVVDYVANLYDLAEMEQDATAKAELQKKADAAFNALGSEAELLPLQSQVETLRAVRKSVRDVTALIKGITDWTVPAGYSNEHTDVVKWVQDKLNTELADQLDGVSVTVSIGVYDITPSKPGVDGKFTATIYLSKEVTADSGDKLSSKNELTIKGVLKASAALSADASVSSVTVCNIPATASEDGRTYTVTVPYGSTVTAESFTITLSSNAASVTADPAETEESGVWAFTVTAENGTTADYTVKVLVAADPAEGNKAAVDAAKAMLEKTDFIYASRDVNTEAAAKAAVERQIGALLGDTDISYEVTMTGFTAAVDGTLWSEPTNGSFSFTVKLTKGENDSYAEAKASLTGTITAASKPVTPPTPSKPTKPSTKPTDEPAKPDASKFVDVSKNNWYFDAVQYVLENGLMNGTSANEFSPNADTTRGMIVTILARLDGVDTSGSSPWYAAGRTWAMNAGVSDGTNMDGKITREQLAAMLYRYAKSKGYDVSASADISGYTDASSVSGWAKEAMQWAVGSGLIQGSGNALTSQANASRAQIATILMRFAQKIAK